MLTCINYYGKLKKRKLLWFQWRPAFEPGKTELEKQSHSSGFYLLANASFLFFGFTYYAVSRIYVEFVDTLGVLVTVLFLSFKARLEQIWEHLQSGKRAFFSGLRLRLHLRYNADSAAFLADFNRLYGTGMWAFFLVGYPENAFMWMGVILTGSEGGKNSQSSKWGLQKGVSPLLRALVLVTSVLADLFTFALLYKAIGLTARMYDCASYMTGVAVHSKSIQGDLKSRLKLERYLDLFHSKTRPHTVTYGRHGPVTTASFGKVRSDVGR